MLQIQPFQIDWQNADVVARYHHRWMASTAVRWQNDKKIKVKTNASAHGNTDRMCTYTDNPTVGTCMYLTKSFGDT